MADSLDGLSPASLSERFRSIGLTVEESRRTSTRHAAVRDDPAAVALRLFRDGGAATTEEVSLLGAGETLLTRAGEEVRARFRLDFVRNLLLFSDWHTGDSSEVLAPGETTAILYRAALATAPVGRVLDLGCGCGALALLLARRAELVTGSDINPRAVALARFNAALNGIANADFRLGSLFEPVSGERFDLIVSQPPFVPLPNGAVQHTFLHGGTRGDELARRIIAAAPAHLTATGRALIFSDWPLRAGETLRERLTRDDCRLTVLASEPITVEAYAASYGHELAGHFASIGVIGIRQCLAVVDKGSGYEERAVLPHEWAHLNP